jgi:hypothetical protein
LRAKTLESVSDVTLAVFSSAFGHFRFNRCALCGVRGRNAAKQRRPFTGLGYKRERALSELPKKIDALHAEIASLHRALADPDFYRQDAKAFAAKTARLGVARSELEAAETEWLELEILREELKS